MAKTTPISFRIPSKYVVFLDALARQNQMTRTQVLIHFLEQQLQFYLKQQKPVQQQPVRPKPTRQEMARLDDMFENLFSD